MNKLSKALGFFTKNLYILFILGFLTLVTAQEESFDSQSSEKLYELGGINVIGDISYNPQTVITFSGLKTGQKIWVPGEEISSAIKKLWKLGLFEDVNIYINSTEGDKIFLDLHLNELPKLSETTLTGLKKSKKETLLKELDLKKGKVVNENVVRTTKNYIVNKYQKDGYYNTKVIVTTQQDTAVDRGVNMLIKVDRGKKAKVKEIVFEGNERVKSSQLRKAMKSTKKKNVLRVWKASKYIEKGYKDDLVKVTDKYKEKGYRDARIVSQTVSRNEDKTVSVKIKLEEGNKYHIRSIKFLGNSVYTDQELNNQLGIKAGDVYNGVLLQKRIKDETKPDGIDITNMYQNNGYLFSSVNIVETATVNDSIDFEIRITEGPLAYFNKITVVGNDRTNDHVIYRELRTLPGQKYSQEKLVRTIRELGQLGYFDPETINPEFKNVDATAGTVDIEYNLTEKGSSQVELQGGYGGGGFIGTLGLSFNNFSIQNIFDKKSYKPLPLGDGQQFSLRLQGSTYFQTYSVSFSEPWLGGKKPVRFSTSLSQTKQFGYNYLSRAVDRSSSLNISTVSIGIAKRLSVPDDYFVLSQALSYQYFDLDNYYQAGVPVSFREGVTRNLAYTFGLTRNNKGLNPVFPTYGSEFSITGKFTFPYSLVNGIDYANLGNDPAYQDANGLPDEAAIQKKRFNWLEYYKIKFSADWYTKVYGKLTLRTLGEFGFLGAYNHARGIVPFERFYLGGDGMANFTMDGREIIQLRGYPNQSLAPTALVKNPLTGAEQLDVVGGTLYNKFSMELRYPVTLKPSASIFLLTFMEAGTSYEGFRNYNPFSLYRSSGAGLRVFMPAFGMLGFDFGYGFDTLPGETKPNGWETHFIIGQQF